MPIKLTDVRMADAPVTITELIAFAKNDEHASEKVKTFLGTLTDTFGENTFTMGDIAGIGISMGAHAMSGNPAEAARAEAGMKGVEEMLELMARRANSIAAAVKPGASQVLGAAAGS